MAAATPAPQTRRPSSARSSSSRWSLVLAWQLAYWTWVSSRRRTVAAPARARADVDLAAIARLFGATPPALAPAACARALRLKGVVAPTPGVGASAIFSTGAGRTSRSTSAARCSRA